MTGMDLLKSWYNKEKTTWTAELADIIRELEYDINNATIPNGVVLIEPRVICANDLTLGDLFWIPRGHKWFNGTCTIYAATDPRSLLQKHKYLLVLLIGQHPLAKSLYKIIAV